MHIPFSEPTSAPYIYINPKTNRVHILVPIVGGQDISTDNTCKTHAMFNEFFDGKALKILKQYKKSLELDLVLLDPNHPQRALKEERFAQLDAYIISIDAMMYSHGDALIAFKRRASNLHAIQLRPVEIDLASRVINPTFSVERGFDARGTPLSQLYLATHKIFAETVVASQHPRDILIRTVLKLLTKKSGFAKIQQVLAEQTLALFGIVVDYKQFSQAHIDKEMGFVKHGSTEDYIDCLLGYCAKDIWIIIPTNTSPFYSIPSTLNNKVRQDYFPIMTQFYLAHFGVYCKSKGISDINWGPIFDNSKELSTKLVQTIAKALTKGDDVGQAIGNFINSQADTFKLSRALDPNDLAIVKQQFENNFRTITATTENPHMDDFFILDKEAKGAHANCVTFKGAFCVNLAEIVDPVTNSINSDFFDCIRSDFAEHPAEIPHKNEGIPGGIEIDIEGLLTRMNFEQFNMLPSPVQEQCKAYPVFQLWQFLNYAARGKEQEAKELLTSSSVTTQSFLIGSWIFTDYSGRIFNCTAYEYACWTKDTYMRRILENHMDDATRARLQGLVEKMHAINPANGQPIGLSFIQNNASHSSLYYDLSPLKQALTEYANGYDQWKSTNNNNALKHAWLKIGMAQREVPASVAQAFCQTHQAYDPNTGKFHRHGDFTRTLVLKNMKSWFPLNEENPLGFTAAIARGKNFNESTLGDTPPSKEIVAFDLEVLNALEKLRNEELQVSYTSLPPRIDPSREKNSRKLGDYLSPNPFN